ncbi:MAG TPA: hypothetical protein ENN17_00835 [bacterium]|nr:hypothetical protein [bacterium]
MRNRTVSVDQQNLFGLSEPEVMRRRVRALDREIAAAMKSRRYDQAKQMAEEQAVLIKQLVELGEGS